MPPAASLTRKSKKDDVEALLSDFDILDDNGRSISAPQQASQSMAAAASAGEGSAPRDRGANASGIDETALGRGAKAGHADEASTLLADLDDLVKQRRSATPKQRLSQLMMPATVSSAPRSSSGLSSAASRTGAVGATGDTQSPLAAPASEAAQGSELTGAPALQSANPGDATSKSAQPAAAPSWGSWWSSATKLADQARVELEKRAVQVQAQVAERAKEASAAAVAAAQAPGSDGDGAAGGQSGATNVKPWMLAQNVNSFLKTHAGDLNKLRADLGKVGQRGWNEILHVVAPPIESHEVLSITLSHDMVAFDGVQDVVFQVLQRVMEAHAASQDAEHQLVVNSAPRRPTSIEEAPKTAQQDEEPDLKPVRGFDQGWKVADSKLEELIKQHDAESSKSAEAQPQADGGVSLPITKCPLYIRIQPILASLPGVTSSSPDDRDSYVFIAILLRDTANNLTHRTVSQPILQKYAAMSFEEQPWAEDLLSESLQGALSSVGIDYIRSRMQARTEALAKAVEAVQTSEIETRSTPMA